MKSVYAYIKVYYTYIWCADKQSTDKWPLGI